MLKTLRKKNNLTQAELSYLAKVSIKTISRIEKGEKNINYSTLEKLARFFNVEKSEIIK